MNTLRWISLVAGVGVGIAVFSPLEARRSKEPQDFPDYNRLEYAQPRPSPDKQVAEPTPGGFHIEVGGKKKSSDLMPLDELPVSLRQAPKADTSEPPMDFMDARPETAASEAPVVGSTVAVSTTPATNAPVQ